MSDAVVLFHPPQREALLPFLDLDDDDEDANDAGDANDADDADDEEASDGVYAEELEDGSFLLYTFQPFEVFAQNHDEARTWLAQFGVDASALHDDPRGFLFFPDTVEPEAGTYDGVVAEAAGEGFFVTAAGSPLEAAMAGIDPNLLQALADQLLGGAGAADGGGGGPKAPLPFEIGKLIEGFQGHLLASLGAAGDEHGEHDDDDEDDDDDHEGAEPPVDDHGEPKT